MRIVSSAGLGYRGRLNHRRIIFADARTVHPRRDKKKPGCVGRAFDRLGWPVMADRCPMLDQYFATTGAADQLK